MLNFIFREKKAAVEELVKVLAWIVFFIIVVGGVYLLVKSLTKV